MTKNYNKNLIDILTKEFVAIMDGDQDFYSKYNFVLSNEQQFVTQKDRSPHKIYIVVKFLKPTLFHGQTIAPITINAVGEANSIDVVQRLLLEFAQTYNLDESETIDDTDLVKQFYDGPQVINNFTEINNTFRTLFYMGGTFLIGEQSNPFQSIEVANVLDENGNPYNIQFLNASWSWDNQLDPQAYTTTRSRTVSEAKISTLTLSVIIYLRNDNFCNQILGMAFNLKDDGGDYIAALGNKTTFYLNITFKNGYKVSEMPFKVANVGGQQNLGEFPSVSITLTN